MSTATLSGTTPDTRARRVAESMWTAEQAAHWPGLSPDAAASGRIGVSERVGPRPASRHGTCHGGWVIALADRALPAGNSHASRTVSARAISDLAPARAGARLRNVAVGVARGGRPPVFDITVTNQDAAAIAPARATARRIGGTIEETDHG